MMLPILISVSDTPGSYFFSASTVPEVTAAITRVAARAPHRQSKAGILVSLVESVSLLGASMGAPMLLGALMRPGFAGNRTLTLPLFEEVPERLPLRIQHSLRKPSKGKAPCTRGAGGGN